MQRLMLRKVSRLAFSTASQLPKSNALTTASNAEDLATLTGSSTQSIKTHQEYLAEVHQNFDLHFEEPIDGKQILAVSIPKIGSIFPFLASTGVGLFSVYQVFAGSYSYYCILGTIGLAGFIAAKYSRISQYHLQYPIANLVVLDGNQVQVYATEKVPIVAPISDVKYGTLPSSSGRISRYIQIEGKKYVLPSNSKLNKVKIAEVFGTN